jgi:hypothetical protein
MLTAGTDSVSESEMARVCVRAERERVFECVQPLLSLDLLSEQTHNRTNVRRVYRAKANVEGSSPVSLDTMASINVLLPEGKELHCIAVNANLKMKELICDPLMRQLARQRIAEAKFSGIRKHLATAVGLMLRTDHRKTVPATLHHKRIDSFVHPPDAMHGYLDEPSDASAAKEKEKEKTKTKKKKKNTAHSSIKAKVVTKPGKLATAAEESRVAQMILYHYTFSLGGPKLPNETVTLFYTYHEHDGSSYYTIVAIGQHEIVKKCQDPLYHVYWWSPLFARDPSVSYISLMGL